MKTLSTTFFSTLFMMMSSVVYAGFPTPNAGAMVTFGTPVAGAATVVPVPALSSGLLIGLGLLLLVIGVRVLKQHNTLHRPLVFALMSAGLAIGGLGVERVIATSVIYIGVENDICSNGTTTVDMSDVDQGNRGSLANFCESKVLTIISYDLPCPENEWVIANGDTNTEIQPQTEVTLNRCPNPQEG